MKQRSKYKIIKRLLLSIAVIILIFIAYVFISTANHKDMTAKQRILKTIYPAIMWASKKFGNNKDVLVDTNTQPVTSIYSLQSTAIDGTTFNLEKYKGKKMLIVNTASNCGYTNQYEALETLYKKEKDKLVIIAFPANDFKDQEAGTDTEIAQFCKLNYGVSFPLMKKSTVVKSAAQNPVYQWLSSKEKNGWNNQQPTWNFCKYLIDENGKLQGFFAASVDPLSDEITKAINQ